MNLYPHGFLLLQNHFATGIAFCCLKAGNSYWSGVAFDLTIINIDCLLLQLVLHVVAFYNLAAQNLLCHKSPAAPVKT